MEGVIERKLSFASMTIRVIQIGEDWQIILQGGEKPHIGCTVLAVPRPSLTGDGTISSTASVINVTGHKDEYICRLLAEHTAARKNAVVVCTGGFHADNLTEEQLQEIMSFIDKIEL